MQELSSNSVRTQRLIDKLTQWTKKPNLDYNLSTILDSYATQIHEDTEIPHTASEATTNFSEAGLFLQSSTVVYAKQVDLLFKKWIKLNGDLFDLLSTNRENETAEKQRNVTEPMPSTSSQNPKKSDSKGSKKKAAAKEKPKPESAVADVDLTIVKTENESGETPETKTEVKKGQETSRDKVKISIQKIYNRILANSKLQDMDLGILSDSYKGTEDESHPLHPIFVMIADEYNIAKDLFTVNNVELSGLCWTILYQMEKNLNCANAGTSDKTTNTGETCATVNSVVTTTIVSADSTNATVTVNTESTKATVTVNTESTNACTASTSSDKTASDKTTNTSETENTESTNTADTTASATNILLNREPVTIEKTVETSSKSDDNLSESVQIGEKKELIVRLERLSVTIEKTLETRSKSDDNLSESVQQIGEKKELIVRLERLTDSILSKYMEQSGNVQTNESAAYIQNIYINLLDLPEKLLTRKKHFTLPSEYLQMDKRLKLRSGKRVKDTEKRKLNEEPEEEEEDVTAAKKPKTFDLECFDGFFDEFCVQEGYSIQNSSKDSEEKEEDDIPVKTYDLKSFEDFVNEFSVQEDNKPANSVQNCRKSIDARSDRSFHCPFTPDSGRFSLSFGVDSEYENPDTDAEQANMPDTDVNDNDAMRCIRTENINDDEDSCARPDSAMDEGTPFHDAGYESDRTIVGLREIFPNITNNPEMVSLAKEIINTTKPPESEDFFEWKRFIDNKTAGEKEFDIHEFGTNILNAFPDDSMENIISFEKIVEEKTTEDVARYFVSTLQLANTENIKIIDEYPGIVRPDSMKLKFLSRERHHESLQATPGAEQFMNRLVSRRSDTMLQSTPHKHKYRRTTNVHAYGTFDTYSSM